MFRLTQILRNSFIRFEGFITILWQFFANLLRNFFGFFARIFGLNSSSYYLESDQAQSTKPTATQQPSTTVEDSSPETSATARRRPNATMDYYRNMAREVNKS